MMDVNVYRVPMGSPDDVSELEKLIDEGTVNPFEICAIIAQTEGDGYSRGYAALCFELMLSEKMHMSRAEVAARIPMLMIGLTGGLMSPHYTVFTRKEVEAPENSEKRLALGIKITRVLLPEEYGTAVQVKLVAEAVKEAMAEAGITDVADVHCVEVKCPNLTAARLADAQSRGNTCCSTNFAEAGSKFKGASALGVALGLGEIKEDKGRVELPISRKEGFGIMRRVSENGEYALTRYRVLARGLGRSLVLLKLETGRTHQIRVHMAALGHSLYGDFMYGHEEAGFPRTALHSCHISIKGAGKDISLYCPPPDIFFELVGQKPFKPEGL